VSAPTSPTADRLWALLPVVHRLRDAERGGVLRELITVLAQQVDVLDEALDQFYDDQFIETCAEWVAPYIGELIGYRPLYGVAPAVASPRAEVANTIAYRRRKGTAAMLEQLARDVTGWPSARAVEFFERLVTTQYMNHIRPRALATPSMRAAEALAWIGRQNDAFDDLAHTADVRRIDAPKPATRGRYNIPNVGIFLWRTDAVRLVGVPLVQHAGDPTRYRFDPDGADAPLFADPRTEVDITHIAEPYDVPLPLERRWLSDHLSAYYDPDLTLHLETRAPGADPDPIAIGDVRICDLSDVPGGGGAWAHPPAAGVVDIDPVLGRVWFGTAPSDPPRARYHYGLAVPVGAGGYARGAVPLPEPVQDVADGTPLQPALNGVTAGGTVLVGDSDRYPGTPTITTVAAAPGDPDTVVLVRAADRQRPVLTLGAALRLAMDARTSVVLDGLHISGGPVVLDESGDTEIRTITLRNCTLVPGQTRATDGQPLWPDRASLIVLDPFAEVRLENCVVGAIVAVDGASVTARDCVIDAGGSDAVAFCGRASSGGALRTVSGVADQAVGDGTDVGGDLDLGECTVLGGIHANRLDASNSILRADLGAGDPRNAAVWARRRQVGCVRFTYLPLDSRVGTRHKCQPAEDAAPDVALATRPHFASLRYGDPRYVQLLSSTPDAIRRGADDESEMGVTHLLFTPQREVNLLLRLDEYLRFGLSAGSFCAT
jgi:hypothetical protein